MTRGKKNVETRNKVMASATTTVAAVTCMVCGQMHRVDCKDFIAIYGNVMIGMDDTIIGENIDEKGKVIGSTIYCRKSACFDVFVESLITFPNLMKKTQQK